MELFYFSSSKFILLSLNTLLYLFQIAAQFFIDTYLLRYSLASMQNRSMVFFP